MKKTISIIAVFFLFCSLCYAKDVSVSGYTRKDGTYVRPHHRSSPDSDVSNNYGQASYEQRQQYQGASSLPSYNNDYDNDGVANRRDRDDDNDGINDKQDSSQYGRSNSYIFTQPQANNRYNDDSDTDTDDDSSEED